MTTLTRNVAARSSSSIRRLAARYRLPASHVDERRRLDRVITSALSDVLEAALERAGVPITEEICIRALHIVSRVRLDVRDEDLALEWSLAVADAVAQEIRMGGPNVIRYTSRHHALCDLALSAARGDGARTWVWRQLGLWSGPETSSRALLAAGAIEVLACEAHAAAPVLAEVARRGGLLVLATHAPPEHWVALASSAVAAMGGEGSVVLVRAVRDEEMTNGASPARRDSGDIIARASTVAAERVVRASAIISAIRSAAAMLPAATLRALATLAVLETSPEHAMSRATEITRTIDGVQAALRESVATSSSVTEHARIKGESHGPTQRALPSPRDGSTSAAAARESSASPGDEYAIADVRQRATTLAGGVLFLLHLVRDAELVECILDDSALRARGLAWSLHQLAIALAVVEASDVAVLAFCGCRPGDDPPSSEEEPATAEELEAIHAYRAVVVDMLVERLAASDPHERVLASVVRRHAEIVADPGWIEVRFSLDEVLVPVRRAGLDLDPNWLPWLGAVVRFVYG
jgi:hypothetical protein